MSYQENNSVIHPFKLTIMKPFLSTLFVFLVPVLFSLHAQERVIIDDVSTTSPNSVKNMRELYKSQRKRSSFLRKYVDNPYNETALKFNPLQLFRGEIGFTMEQALKDRTSLSLSFGPTISNLNPIPSGHVFPTGGISVQPQLYTESALGMMSALSFRYYPMENDAALNGFFIEPAFKYRKYNENLTDQQEILSDRKGYTSQYRFAFNMGAQRWYSNSFSLEFFLGAGIGYEKDQTSAVFGEYDFETGQVNYFWVDSQTKNATWFISGGINIGIGWSKGR